MKQWVVVVYLLFFFFAVHSFYYRWIKHQQTLFTCFIQFTQTKKQFCLCWKMNSLIMQIQVSTRLDFFFLKLRTQHGAWTPDPEIESHMPHDWAGQAPPQGWTVNRTTWSGTVVIGSGWVCSPAGVQSSKPSRELQWGGGFRMSLDIGTLDESGSGGWEVDEPNEMSWKTV